MGDCTKTDILFLIFKLQDSETCTHSCSLYCIRLNDNCLQRIWKTFSKLKAALLTLFSWSLGMLKANSTFYSISYVSHRGGPFIKSARTPPPPPTSLSSPPPLSMHLVFFRTRDCINVNAGWVFSWSTFLKSEARGSNRL